MEKVQAYIQTHKDRFLNELLDLLRIPSVSADPKHADDMHRMAQAMGENLKNAGLDRVEVLNTEGYPVVYAEKMVGENLPTVLVYGHYDVQPADPIELWHTPPFEPTIKKNGDSPQRGDIRTWVVRR
jgi:acetylornithine deacetylase/succinyl-diaminopimelate desuccinylase-like protein